MPGSKKGQSVLEAGRKVSNAELLVNCNDMYDVQHDELAVHVSPSGDNRNLKMSKYEPWCFHGNLADYPQLVKEFEFMLSGLLLNHEMELTYLLRYCTGVAARAM
ncbi:unnamed protein product [Trichobilharzia regenti]|nr:unnamed protein product [Trichobilharzia regenti]